MRKELHKSNTIALTFLNSQALKTAKKIAKYDFVPFPEIGLKWTWTSEFSSLHDFPFGLHSLG